MRPFRFDMHVLRYILYVAMALVLAGGWTFFYLQSRAAELTLAVGALATLRELREIDARWNDELVAARAGGKPAAKPSSREPRRSFSTVHAQLEGQALQLGQPHIGSAMWPLRQALEAKAALVERVAAGEEQVFQDAYFSSAGPRLVSLQSMLERALDSALDQAEGYRVLLLLYSGFLLTVLLYLAYRVNESAALIRRVNLQLKEANEGLELRVAERTTELSNALAKLKESEAMLIQSEKMSSLGQMVAGVAHEVNTPLAYVKSSLEAVRGGLADTARLAGEVEKLIGLLGSASPDEAQLAAQFTAVQELLAGMQQGGALGQVDKLVKDGLYGIAQISDIVSSLKNFSRLDRAKVADFDLNEGLESALTIARNHLKHRTVRKLFGQIPNVSCSPSQINQVFLNLITNAAQATADSGGVIAVRTMLRDPRHVAVEVSDNGHGIAADVLPKIFDPFFTTKGVGKGTGLGLSISYKIVESHGGRIEVKSEPGKGARFTVVLPIRPPPSAAAA